MLCYLINSLAKIGTSIELTKRAKTAFIPRLAWWFVWV